MERAAMAFARPEFEQSRGHSAERSIGQPWITDRQRQVLDLICQGYRTSEIGVRLGVSSRTIEHHKYAMMHRLRQRTMPQLAVFAVRHNLL